MKFKMLILLMLIPVHCYSYDNKIFGYELGVKFLMPECEVEQVYDLLIYKMPKKGYCWQNIGFTNLDKTNSIINGEVLMGWPDSGLKKHSAWDSVFLFVVDGNFEGVQIITRGNKYHDTLFPFLKEKYGAANYVQGKYAQWNLAGLDVTYFNKERNSGLIQILTPKAKTWKKNNELKKKRSRPSLPIEPYSGEFE